MVKNVTGYDLCKLLAGSWGTLAVMTEVTLKVMPRPESERTLVLRGLDDVTANRAMTAALGSPFDVSGAAHLPNSAFRPAAGGAWRASGRRAGGHAAAAGRHCGFGRPSRGHRWPRLLAPFGAAEMVEDAASAAIWRGDPRRRAVRRQRRARRLAGVADRLSAGLGRRARPGSWRAIPAAR